MTGDRAGTGTLVQTPDPQGVFVRADALAASRAASAETQSLRAGPVLCSPRLEVSNNLELCNNQGVFIFVLLIIWLVLGAGSRVHVDVR